MADNQQGATGSADTATDDAQAQQALADAAKGQQGDQNGQQATTSDTDTSKTVDHAAEAEKWRAMARKHEAAAKTNADAAKRLAALEDGQKTEAQKLSDTLAEREVELAELRTEKARATAGAAAKLDPDLWEFITATEPDEALAQAKRLAKATAPVVADQQSQTSARADMRQGARQTAQAAQTPNDWLRNAANRQ